MNNKMSDVREPLSYYQGAVRAIDGLKFIATNVDLAAIDEIPISQVRKLVMSIDNLINTLEYLRDEIYDACEHLACEDEVIAPVGSNEKSTSDDSVNTEVTEQIDSQND